ncbi:glycoside hydrolase family 3 C-terminal domain-containing protein [Sanguibacter sp. HDW7]|uniref:glycoside hydrolase family 3 C-terminal domain-containing protein n=1 Tax=Sanguibacter sp. HDW7 TaxID=2714931 RepID=UPI00140BC141|nr:glycoside hydrolase family 3 C-terminal domain-containing protein [Sanguibacter sp. HDW7]QIK83133.1 beta-glucosidase [Sanguibacter sp. HDW7]
MTDRTADLAAMTTAEKASLTSGADFWTTKAVATADVPSIMLTDGPHGLRKQSGDSDHLGLNDSVPATCFPPAAALASTFDPALAERVGAAIGVEAAIENVGVVLGPGTNLKRSPLCGRNFEYMSEDPILSGAMGAGLVTGIQSQGVGSSLKHFAANNQEDDRMRVSADIDPRPLRELYLRGFERVVKAAQPWTVMCSYNKINGVYASQDHWLLTEVLRDDWGFEGLVVSDWGAVADRVAALTAGLDLEMPAGDGRTDAQIVAAIAEGQLEESVLDTAASRVVDLVRKTQARPAVEGPLDGDAHHALAREAAGRSIVLLKNDGGILPLAPDASVAVVGEFARTPRFQGGGSSHINPTRLDSALDALGAVDGLTVGFAPGFAFDGSDADALRAEAVRLAGAHDVVVVFLGLPDTEESEGFDRTHIDLPTVQLELLDALLEANPNVVVVLSNGAVVALPFADRVPAVVETWLLGQAGGTATVDVLTGAVNPSGRLAETIPHRLEDTPAFGSFPGSFGHVRYGEGMFVGYRWYDQRRMDVTFPFGHGLSYTTFAYGSPTVTVAPSGDLTVTVPVTNTGDRDGREVVQVYVAPLTSAVERAPRELKAFANVEIAAGASQDVTVTVPREDLAYWDIRVDRWVVEGGTYRVDVAASSRDVRGSATVEVSGDEVSMPLTHSSSVGELVAHPVVGPMVLAHLSGMQEMAEGAAEAGLMADDGMMKLMASFPIGRLAGFPGMGVTHEQVDALIEAANAG